jgi:hypothetical protein
LGIVAEFPENVALEIFVCIIFGMVAVVLIKLEILPWPENCKEPPESVPPDIFTLPTEISKLVIVALVCII